MVKLSDNTSSSSTIRILKGSTVSMLITLILLIVFATVLTYTNLNEAVMPTVTIVITSLSILIGSQLTTRHIKKNGIINGALVGILYITFLYIVSSFITKNFSFNNYSIIMIITSILLGGLGGIIGVNKKNS